MHGEADDARQADERSLPAPDGPPDGDLYEILQVSPRASLDVIQAAYRVLARSHHPDLNGSPTAADAMRRLNAAYRVLSDPARRAQYDVRRPASSWSRPIRASTQVRRRPVLTARVAVSERPSPAGLLMARIGVTVVITMLVVVVVLLFWTLLNELDDRPAPGFRPRAGAWAAVVVYTTLDWSSGSSPRLAPA